MYNSKIEIKVKVKDKEVVYWLSKEEVERMNIFYKTRETTMSKFGLLVINKNHLNNLN